MAAVVLVISALTWFDSQKRSELIKSTAESLKFIAAKPTRTKGTSDSKTVNRNLQFNNKQKKDAS